jgi:hypothetical protein
MIKITAFSLAILTSIAIQAQEFGSVQDSTRSGNPEPVVITQDGYDPAQGNPSYKPLSERSFKERLKYGGSLGPFSFSDSFSWIGVSPMIGYTLTEKTILGLGLSYNFIRQRDNTTRQKIKTDLVGFSAFIRQDVPFTQNLGFPLYATVEAEQYQGVQQKYQFKPALLVGLGMGSGGSYGFQLLYDLNFDSSRSFTSTGSPFVIRVTGFFN